MRTSRARGPKPFPGRLTPEFSRAIRNSEHPRKVLAAVSGVPRSRLSQLLYTERASITPLIQRRLAKLASVIEFKGDLIEAEKTS